LLRDLGDFGVGDGFGVVVFDSPGAGVRYIDALLSSLEALPKVLPLGEQKPVLVCDREAAGVVALHIARVAPLVSGLVMVGSGAIPVPALEALRGVPLRLVPLSGYPSSVTIERLLAYVEAAPAAEREALDVRLLHGRSPPWPHGVGCSLPELRAFVRGAFGLR
jgi:hypothetical protein